MLKAISWGQFGIFLLVVTAAYYGYVLLVYYKSELFGRRRREGASLADEAIGHVGGKEKDGKMSDGEPAGSGAEGNKKEKAAVGQVGQTELFATGGKREGPVGGSGEPLEIVPVVFGKIREVVRQAVEGKQELPNVVDHLKEVLRGYRKSAGPKQAETINNFVVHLCSTELSLEISHEEVARWWK